ncbi:metallophosphoesterase [Phytomonospora sp. NPDC050363]|uniref:metallophosphoesterase n=1 Tax=Phytomonospora sp. NPDC050363 TaxID=3155642 RepID=UPI0033F2320F
MRTGRKLVVATAAVALLIASTAVASAADEQTSAPDRDGVALTVPQIDQVTQLTEPGAAARPASITGGAGDRASGAESICDQDARWLRPRFSVLDLRGGDSVTVTGSTGGSYVLTARNWPGRAFHTRAFPGSCVSVSARLSDPGSRFAVDSYQYGTTDLALATVTVAGAGDICGTACNQTDDLIASINPVSVFTAGDNAYESGTLAEFNDQYAPTWGAFRSKTYPTPGNHEYGTSGAKGYFDYFNGTGNNSGRAGERGKGYYSYDVGDWHFVALNSDIAHGTGSAQEQWLKADLAASTKPCTAAYTHHPRFSGGDHGDDTGMNALVTALYNAKADIFVTGHDHHYERFAPATPSGAVDNANGLRHFVIGTGGRALYSSRSTTAGPTQVFNNNTFGVGKFQLTATGYTMDFVPVAGRTFTDRVTGTCHKASQGPDFGVAASPSSVSVPQGSSGTSTVTVSSSGGFASAVTLSASGLPSGVSAVFTPAAVTPAANGSATSTLRLSATAAAATGTYQVTVTGTSGSASRTAAVSLTVSGSGSAAFSDDFESDKGWAVNASGSDTATIGRWERGDPDQTVSTYSDQVKQLGTTVSGGNALSTGRAAGSAYGANDLDGGVTSIRSPALTVPAGASLTFAYNVAHGDNSSSADYLRVSVVSASGTAKVWETLGAASEVAGTWRSATVSLSAYAGQSVTLLVAAADASGGSLFEAQVDDVKVAGSSGAASPGYSVAVHGAAVFDGVAVRD